LVKTERRKAEKIKDPEITSLYMTRNKKKKKKR